MPAVYLEFMATIGGVIAAAVTPRRHGPEVDLGAVFELVDFLAASGVSGIGLLGSTGEYIHFSLEDRIRMVKLGVKRSRVPVVAGVSHSTFDGAVALAREAADAGAAALLVAPPHFFRYSQEEIRDFYFAFAGEAGRIPILLYNIPQFASRIEPDTAAELLATGVFAGIKDSSGSWADFVSLAQARETSNFSLLAGHDVMFTPARMAGADGIVSGVASAVPELLVALDRAIACGKRDLVWRLDARLQEFLRRMCAFAPPVAIREAAAARGIKVGPHAIAPGAAETARLAAFREWFTGWLPGVLKEAENA